MSLPAESLRSLPSLASEINAEHEAAERAINDSLAHARRCGELLIEAKAQCGHGKFGAWLADNFPASHRTAQGYMRIASKWAANAQALAHLGIEEALAALAEPRGPEPEPPARESGTDWLRRMREAQAPAAPVLPVSKDGADEDGKGPVAAPSEERIEMQEEPDLPSAPPPGRVPKRIPVPEKLRDLVRVATELTDPTDAEIKALGANDIMLQRLRIARDVIDRIIAVYS